MIRTLCTFSLLTVLAGCGGQEIDRRPDILLVTFDTLRADRLGCYGHDRIETPVIDALAARGVRFTTAYSPIPVTLPAHTTILTGLYPHQHGVRNNGDYQVSDDLETLGEILQAAGYETAAFVSSYVLHGRYNLDQGFLHYDDSWHAPSQIDADTAADASPEEALRRWQESQTRSATERDAASVAASALRWLESRDGSKPFFCWAHFYDPHSDYSPPRDWADRYGGRYDGPVDGNRADYLKLARTLGDDELLPHTERMIELYDAEIAYADERLGELLAAVPPTTLVVFVSDHGEGFTEHGRIFEHMNMIFEETVRIPMILAGPGVGDAGSRRSEMVSTLDIFPTILEYAGIQSERSLPGHSLLHRPLAGEERALYFETRCGESGKKGGQSQRGIRTVDWSLILRFPAQGDPVARLHDLRNDPSEIVSLLDQEPEVVAALAARFRELDALAPEGEATDSYRPIADDDEAIEHLRELGYIE